MKKHYDFKEGDGMSLENSTAEERIEIAKLLKKEGYIVTKWFSVDFLELEIFDLVYAKFNGNLEWHGTGGYITNPKTHAQMKALILEELEVGKWHVYIEDRKVVRFICEPDGEKVKSYGFDRLGNWTDDRESNSHWVYMKSAYFEPATDTEVEKALTKEAIERGFVGGATIDNRNLSHDCGNGTLISPKTTYNYENSSNSLWVESTSNLAKNRCIFENGQWATVIQKETWNFVDAVNAVRDGSHQIEKDCDKSELLKDVFKTATGLNMIGTDRKYYIKYSITKNLFIASSNEETQFNLPIIKLSEIEPKQPEVLEPDKWKEEQFSIKRAIENLDLMYNKIQAIEQNNANFKSTFYEPEFKNGDEVEGNFGCLSGWIPVIFVSNHPKTGRPIVINCKNKIVQCDQIRKPQSELFKIKQSLKELNSPLFADEKVFDKVSEVLLESRK